MNKVAPNFIRRERQERVTLGLKKLWEYRELLYFLTWRDIKVRYKQTVIGGGWAVLQPFLTMVVFSIVFGKLAKVPSDGIPYPIFTFAALVPWTLFSNGLTKSSTSLVGNANLLRKVYFPRLIIPISGVLSGFIDFLIALGVLVVMMFYFGEPLTWRIFFLPLFVLLAMSTSLGIGFWFSALNVRFRDIRYIIPFLTQMWLFLTPIAYPSSLINEPWRTIYGCNPMVGVVEGFRWSLLGSEESSGMMLFISTTSVLIVLISGMYYFRRMESIFPDIV